jgi:hypothetical protein
VRGGPVAPDGPSRGGLRGVVSPVRPPVPSPVRGLRPGSGVLFARIFSGTSRVSPDRVAHSVAGTEAEMRQRWRTAGRVGHGGDFRPPGCAGRAGAGRGGGAWRPPERSGGRTAVGSEGAEPQPQPLPEPMPGPPRQAGAGAPVPDRPARSSHVRPRGAGRRGSGSPGPRSAEVRPALSRSAVLRSVWARPVAAWSPEAAAAGGAVCAAAAPYRAGFRSRDRAERGVETFPLEPPARRGNRPAPAVPGRPG